MFVVKYTSHTPKENRDEVYGPFLKLEGAEKWAFAKWGDSGAWYVLPVLPAGPAYGVTRSVMLYQ